MSSALATAVGHSAVGDSAVGHGTVGDELGVRARELCAEASSMPGRPSLSWLAEAAAHLAEVSPPWAELTGAEPVERSYRRLAASAGLEAWLICWPTDGHLQLHDHGGADGALHVVDGVLDERGIDERGDDLGCVAGLRRRLVRTGEGVSFDGSYVHDVRNTEPAPATSVHLYTPAQRPMAFYRLGADGSARVVRTAS